MIFFTLLLVSVLIIYEVIDRDWMLGGNEIYVLNSGVTRFTTVEYKSFDYD